MIGPLRRSWAGLGRWLRRGDESLSHGAEERLPGIAARHFDYEAADAAFDPGADLEKFEANGADVGAFEFGSGESMAAKVRTQHVRRGGQEHTELIRDKPVTTGAVGEQTKLLFFDAVFHVAALAVNVFVKRAWLADQVGDHEAGISLVAGEMLGLGDDASQSAPGAGGIQKLPEEAMRFAVELVLLPHLIEIELKVALQYFVACQTEQIMHVVAFAPIHDAMPAEAAVASENDADIRPRLPQPADEQFQDGAGVQGRIDVRRPQISDQEMIAAKDVEREKAVGVIVAVEEAFFLMSVDGIVGGVEIEDEFLGRRRLRLDELFDEDGRDVEERLSANAVFEPAQGGRRTEFGKFVGTGMIGDGLPQGIGTKLLMIVEIFVSAGDAENALGEQSTLRMQNEIGIAWIGNDAIEGVDQTELPIGLPQQQGSCIRSDDAAAEIGNEIPGIATGKRHRV